jgi:RimK family alpha-L-glutamate ligase
VNATTLTLDPALASPARSHPPLVEARAVIVATAETLTNVLLADAFTRLGYRGEIVPPHGSLATGAADVLLGRLDVKPTLDGVEDGLWELAAAASGGALLLNPPQALHAAHDKLATALMLARSGVPHPATAHVVEPTAPASLEPPYVVKPRYGSWGRDVFRCDTKGELERLLASLATRPWFRAHGAVVQEYVGAGARDLRLVVAGGAVIGAIERVARPGEWRTNVSLGGVRRRAAAPTEARQLALRAVAALGLDLAGVDLLRGSDGELVVLEVNGAVDFTPEYAAGGDVFAAAARALVPAEQAASGTA